MSDVSNTNMIVFI